MLRNLPVETGRRNFLKRLPGSFAETLRALGQGFFGTGGDNPCPARVARIDVGQCLAWGGMNCQQCYLACPLRDKAILMVDAKPVIAAASCDGCGQCESACLTVNDRTAVRMILSIKPV